MSYADILDRYVVDLADARDEVIEWWERLLRDASAPAGDVAAAEKIVRARWPLGPASHPRVVAVFRQYFLETEAYNAKKEDAAGEDDEGVFQPSALLLGNLEQRDPELAAFMQGFVFLSIGTDPDGNIA